jgi:hypothetical protein
LLDHDQAVSLSDDLPVAKRQIAQV